jgi:hypothetical protein
VRRFLLLLLVAAAVVWILRDRPTVAGLIDSLTSSLFESKAAVGESEHKRVVAEAGPVLQEDQDIPIGMLKVGMSASEVRRVLGRPDSIADVETPRGRRFQRWAYLRIGRRIDLEEGRVVSIAIR